MDGSVLSPRSRRALFVASLVLASLLALLLLCLLFVALFDWNSARGPVARFAGKRLHREVHIDGPLNVHVFSRNPSIEVGGLRIGNPDWLPGSDMADLGHLRVAMELSQLLRFRLVLERVELEQLQLNLVQDKDARANWQFAPAARTDSSGAHLPAMKRFTLNGGNLSLDDAVHRVRFSGQMNASEQGGDAAGGAAGAEPFRLQGDGEFNGEPFHLLFGGGGLLNLRVDEPYPFHADVRAGATHVELRGRLPKPFDFGRFGADVHATGRNLADLYYLTGLALPRTAAYELAVQLERRGTHLDMRDIAGKMGSSDIRGTAAVDLEGARPRLTADVVSNSLRLADLGIAFGAGAANSGKGSGSGAGAGESAGASGKSADERPEFLLPRTPIELDHLQQMDAHVNFRATAVQAAKVPFQRVNMEVMLDNGVLRVDPMVFTLPQGDVTGQLRIDTRAQPAAVSIDARLRGVQLEQFKKKGATVAPLKGTLQARATMTGHGGSVHEIMASGDGRITAVIPGGEIRDALAELMGINVLRGLGLLLSGTDQRAAIRCGVAEFNVKQGKAETGRLVIDTEHVLVEGDGYINFDDESLHLDLAGKPKQLRLVRLRTPINVRGTLAKPSIGVEARHAVAQGGVAAALGALTPLATILAFIDPGLAKDENCAALQQEAEAHRQGGK